MTAKYLRQRLSGPAVGDAPIARKERWPLRQHRQHRLRREQVDSSRRNRDMPGPQGCRSESAPDALSLTLLTVLTVFSGNERIRITLLPDRPWRLNAISIPSARRNVCARRKWPARARGVFGQPVPSLGIRSLLRSTLTRRRSAALPVQGALAHELTHASGDRIGVDDALDRGLAVGCEGASEGVGRPETFFARRGPEREVGHSR